MTNERSVDETQTELLFAYGTLQLEAVQMATFGRRLAGTSDALPGFELLALQIDDPAVVATSGKAQHTMANFTVVLLSGRQAWTYVDARSALPDPR